MSRLLQSGRKRKIAPLTTPRELSRFAVRFILVSTRLETTSDMPVPIKIKHAGKSYDLDVDTSAPATVFKEQVFTVTGVPIDKVKIVVKGGMLKVRTRAMVWCALDSHILESWDPGRCRSEQTWVQSGAPFLLESSLRLTLTRRHELTGTDCHGTLATCRVRGSRARSQSPLGCMTGDRPRRPSPSSTCETYRLHGRHDRH